MKSKKMIFCLCLFTAVALTGCGQSIPKYINDRSADELITEYYDESEIQTIMAGQYENLYELMKDFSLECIRKPELNRRAFPSENRYGYVLLFSEDGGRVFVFFDDETEDKELLWDRCIYTHGFMTYSEVDAVLKTFQQDPPHFTNWRELDQYDTGYSTGGWRWQNYFVTEEGVFVVSRGNGEYPPIYEILFYSDDLLFGESESTGEFIYSQFAPILPIDK